MTETGAYLWARIAEAKTDTQLTAAIAAYCDHNMVCAEAQQTTANCRAHAGLLLAAEMLSALGVIRPHMVLDRCVSVKGLRVYPVMSDVVRVALDRVRFESGDYI